MLYISIHYARYTGINGYRMQSINGGSHERACVSFLQVSDTLRATGNQRELKEKATAWLTEKIGMKAWLTEKIGMKAWLTEKIGMKATDDINTFLI